MSSGPSANLQVLFAPEDWIAVLLILALLFWSTWMVAAKVKPEKKD